MSTTYGAETSSLAAALAVMQIYEQEPVIEHLHRQGERLMRGINDAITENQLEGYFQLAGRPCNLVYVTRDANKDRSQAFRTLFLQETIKRGLLMPSLVVSYSHADADVDRTVEGVAGALGVYRQALDAGVEQFLVGKPVKPVFRPYN